MSQAASLSDYIPSPVLAVAATYAAPQSHSSTTHVYICGAQIQTNNTLELILPKGHQLSLNEPVTVHLDNRTGVSEYDAELSVYRLSYKGQITLVEPHRVWLSPLEFQVVYGISVQYEYCADGYQFPADPRPVNALPTTPLLTSPPTEPLQMDADEHDNKIGVLVTQAQSQPHTTVMAFLSSTNDDIFFITFPNTFKSGLMKRNNLCYFAIDNRATFTFEEAIEWNYSIIQGSVYDVPKHSTLFNTIKELFIAKNPWEMGFFSHPEVEMFHLKPEKVICPVNGEESAP